MAAPDKSQKRRWVVKVGSSVLAAADGTLKADHVHRLAAQVAALKAAGDEVVVVSSGAVASGFRHLGYERPPTTLPDRQACASVGQLFLVAAYEDVFSAHGYCAGLVLLTHDDFAVRSRYLNARNTIERLLKRGAVPIINENDAVAVEEILVGDNDQLASMVAAMIAADILVLLTDVAGVYDRDPKEPGAVLLARIDDAEAVLGRIGAGKSDLGRGGMRSKLRAAIAAGKYGIDTIIAAGAEPDVLTRLAAGERVGTYVAAPAEGGLSARDFWIRFVTRPKGTLKIDAGAVRALVEAGRSLLPRGIVAVEGAFQVGDPVTIVGPDNVVVARGLVEYDAAELKRIAGRHSEEIEAVLGYSRTEAAVHRDDLVLEVAVGDAGGVR